MLQKIYQKVLGENYEKIGNIYISYIVTFYDCAA